MWAYQKSFHVYLRENNQLGATFCRLRGQSRQFLQALLKIEGYRRGLHRGDPDSLSQRHYDLRIVECKYTRVEQSDVLRLSHGPGHL